MKPTSGSTSAILVAYRAPAAAADIARRLAHVIDTVVVVDNAGTPDAGLQEVAGALGALHLHHGNRGGLAGAYNAALAALDRLPTRPAAVLFVDEDSDVDGVAAFLRDPEVVRLIGNEDTAAVSPAYRDRHTGLRGRYIQLGRWRLTHLQRDFAGPRQVAFVINSLSLWRRDALLRIGPFDESLGVDHVDTDACLRARSQGLRLYAHGSHVFAHAIGKRRAYRFMGRMLQAGGHSPERRYSIARNTCWLARQWCWREPAFAALCVARLAYECLGIMRVEDDAGPKIAAVLRGMAAGLIGPPRR